MEMKTTLHRAIPFGIAAGVAAMVALTVPRTVTADAESSGCNNRTLRGDYGFGVSGVRGTGPTTTEAFVGTGLRTYDGFGAFVQVDNTHGQITQANLNQPASGTYQVNSDCTGVSKIFFPGVPFAIETAFVIVDGGDEVKDAVMKPQPNLVTAALNRVRH